MSTTAPQPDPALDALLSEVVGAVEQELRTEAGCPDFAAAVSLARELDPSRVSAQQVAEVAQYAPVVSLAGQRRRRSTGNDLAMAAFVAEVRASVDVDVAEAFAARAAAGAPGAVAPVAGTVTGHSEPATPRLWATVLAVAAALVVVGGGVVSAVGLTEDAVETRSEAALYGDGDVADDGAVEHREQAVEPSAARAVPAVPESTALEPAPEPAVEAEVAQTAPAAPKKAPAERRAGKRAAPRMSLAELDAAAREAWRAGDRDEAKRLFTRVVSRGGTGQLAQMAYGDLMALARQQGARGTEASLWRAYLRRFPKGVFADDARAGLCRRAPDDAGAACWDRYLDDFPSGSHAKAARRMRTAEPERGE